MFQVINKNIYVNHGDAMTLTIVNNTDAFEAGDHLKFSICEKGNYNNTIFQHTFEIPGESGDTAVQVDLEFQDTIMENLWNAIENPSSNEKIYYYEIELVEHNATLIGQDRNGAKLFTVYPEAQSNSQEEAE